MKDKKQIVITLKLRDYIKIERALAEHLDKYPITDQQISDTCSKILCDFADEIYVNGSI